MAECIARLAEGGEMRSDIPSGYDACAIGRVVRAESAGYRRQTNENREEGR